jgi:hypothetical protein
MRGRHGFAAIGSVVLRSPVRAASGMLENPAVYEELSLVTFDEAMMSDARVLELMVDEATNVLEEIRLAWRWAGSPDRW